MNQSLFASIVFVFVLFGLHSFFGWVLVLSVIVFFLLAALLGLIMHMKLRAIESAWTMRKTESPPNVDTINVEIRTGDGAKKILWRVRPEDIDFTDNAKEPVISFMIVKVG